MIHSWKSPKFYLKKYYVLKHCWQTGRPSNLYTELCIPSKSQKFHKFPIAIRTDERTVKVNYRVASLLSKLELKICGAISLLGLTYAPFDL